MSAPASIELGVRPSTYTGILPCQKIREMVAGGEIVAATGILSHQAIEPDQIQPASIDLRLGDFAYPVDASFLPGKGLGVLDKMRELDAQYEEFRIDLRAGAVLERGRLYVVPLMESIRLKSDVSAFSNPKSSTGRLDILTRLIADEATQFDQVEEGYAGQLYLEVAPRSFSVVAKSGTRLNQLRFRRTRGETPKAITAADWRSLIATGQVANTPYIGDRTGMLPFSIDLTGARPGALIGWRAKRHTRRIDLERRDYEPLDFWEPLHFHRAASLILDPDEFYILMTKEAIAVPPEFAAEMVPYDTRAGEFRVHYAGFFDPGFGWDAASRRAGSSRGVLEVRSHEVPFLLEHGQTVGWLRYERMAERPDLLYGQDLASHYQGQELRLAKQFRASQGV
ncbi:MAG: 2'-deoxycytidine 5'-triphosphate deaminase [Gammaproteobacteria bacterium]|nr:2'-deoxycytidine 5'-triphosphate deaminase [Gammaproteobacteria bacterium]MBV9621270.1 2'-deoxycytidine 5'-triphosphate deaminase [Gammaproteobacteria bacterium]